jgi:translocator protein
MDQPPQQPDERRRPSRGGSTIALILCLLLSYAAAGVGQLLFDAAPDAWYAQLNKPSFNPPGWVFGPVWSVLYACMGVAAWLVWRQRGRLIAKWGLVLFAVQLALNAAWSPLFFAAHEPGWAFIDIVALWIVLASAVVVFFKTQRVAGILMTPYLLWVSFAAVLNAAIWSLNR